MALISILLRTCSLIYWLILSVHGNSDSVSEPWINAIQVDSKHCVENKCKYLLNVRGSEFLGHSSWRLTPIEGARGSNCDVIYPNYHLKEIDTTQYSFKLEVNVPNAEGRIYFCLHHAAEKNSPFGGRFVHQGGELFLESKNDVNWNYEQKLHTQRNEIPNRDQPSKANLETAGPAWSDLSHDTDVNRRPNSITRQEKEYVEILNTAYAMPLYRTKTARDEGRKAKREVMRLMDVNLTGDVGVTSPAGVVVRKRQVVEIPEIVKVEGLRVEESEKEPSIVDNAVPSILAGTKMTLRLFGDGFTNTTVVAFTSDSMAYGEPCKFLLKGEYMAKPGEVYEKSALFDMVAPEQSHTELFLCAKNLKIGTESPTSDKEIYIHQGSDTWCMIATHEPLLPLWANLIIIICCLIFSALFSGLNLGLMSLDRTELKIIANTGTDTEKRHARAIMPVRDHGNYLLCSILLGNVAVNSTFTILIDGLTSGLFAVIFSTLAIVLLGEITPQAICSRHGLMVGAKTICITKAVMCVTAPLAYPISKILDYMLGEEIGSVYNRERLKELVKVTTDVNDLDNDEVNIISGALELRKKTVAAIMTKLEDVFMLPIDSVLDFETMSEIVKSGYSRIPVYEGSRDNIVTVLFIKDLAFVDPDDATPLRTLCQYYQNACNFVFEDVTLDVMFKQFKDGHKGHMAFVHSINNEGEGDPFYETIGLVTLEDVIEEMIQAEIVDETDVFMDNRTKRLRKRPTSKLQDFTAFAEKNENQRIHISPQLTLATFQFLSSSVNEFRPNVVSETVLRRLLQQDVFRHVRVKGKEKSDPGVFLYQQGKAVDYFALVLEGRVEVRVGREELLFEAGPFAHFGAQALVPSPGLDLMTPIGSLQNIYTDATTIKRHTFVPDYSVRAVTEVTYLMVKRSLYLAAKRATLMEKGVLSRGQTNEQIDTEVDKHLNRMGSASLPISFISRKLLGRSNSSVSEKTGSTDDLNLDKLFRSINEDLSVSGDNRTPSRQVSPNLPTSASPHTRATFSSSVPSEQYNGDICRPTTEAEEQEKLLQ